MSEGRGIAGGQGRSDTEVTGQLDDEDTVVGAPVFMRPQTDEASAERLFEDSAVDVALGQIIDTRSVETDPRGEMPSPVAPLPPQAFLSPPSFEAKTAPLPTIARPRRFSTTAPMPTVAPPVPAPPPMAPMPSFAPPVPAPAPMAPMPSFAPPVPAPAPMPSFAPPVPAPAPMPSFAPPVPAPAPMPRSLPLAADQEARSTRRALFLFAVISILCGVLGLGWFLLTGPHDKPATQPPPVVAPPTPRLVPRHPVAPAPPPPAHPKASKGSSK